MFAGLVGPYDVRGREVNVYHSSGLPATIPMGAPVRIYGSETEMWVLGHDVHENHH